jgi:quercetin dioxygenase-like cupin family protein
MNPAYTFVPDLTQSQDMPPDGILTRTIHADENVKVVLFTFSPGQELSEHTASMPAILHFIRGEATLTLGDDALETHPGTWVHMPALTKHSIRTKTPVVMLLTLIKV